MGFEYDPKTGQWTDTYQDQTQPESLQIGAGVSLKTDKMTPGLSLAEKLDWMENATVEQREAELEERTIAGADQAKEQGFGDGWGFLRDIGRGVGNSVEALGSDYVDLGLGLTDLAVQGASAAVGRGFDGDAVFNDADNPWTTSRRERWKTETQAGQVVSDVLRVGVALLTLPKVGVKGLVTGAKFATLGKASTTTGVLGALTRLDKALKTSSVASSVTKAAGITAGLADKGSDLKRASKLIEDGSELSRYSFKQLSQLGAEGNLLTDAWRSTEAVVSGLAKRKLTFKDLGQALAWDAFVAFNAAGEGDDAFDETFTDMLESWGMPNIPVLQQHPLQSNWTAKLKQMSEGLLMGAAFEGVWGMAQIMRYSRAFRKAGPKEQQLLINALDAESSVLGSSLAKNLLPAAKPSALDNVMEMGGPSARMGWSALDNYAAQVDTARIQNQLTTETQANLLTYQKGVVESNRAAAVRGGSLSTESAGLPFEEVQVTDLGPTPDGTPRLNPSMEIEPVDVQVIRPPTPTVTPQTFRQAWTDYVRSVNGLPDYEELLQDGMVKLERLLPPGRVDGIDWMDAMEKDLNQAGIIQATDSLASNMYLQRGLLEGWASVDPETGFPQFNRKLAFDFDKSENIQKQAQKLDDAAELERYNQWLAGKEPQAGSMDPTGSGGSGHDGGLTLMAFRLTSKKQQNLQILASPKPFARLILMTSKRSSSMPRKQRSWMQPLWKALGMILILFWSPRCSVNGWISCLPQRSRSWARGSTAWWMRPAKSWSSSRPSSRRRRAWRRSKDGSVRQRLLAPNGCGTTPPISRRYGHPVGWLANPMWSDRSSSPRRS